MTRNMGTLDRGLRLGIGAALLVATFGFGVGVGWVQAAMAVIGLMLVGTAVAGVCPPYALFGIKTCRT
jgi:Protein of unknown function (DUF2892)